MKNYILNYLKTYKGFIDQTENISTELIEIKKSILKVSKNGKKLIIIGNGGSSAIASHVSVDFTKSCGVRAINFNESDLLTCFSNDFGYEHAFAKAIEMYMDKGDLLIAISSSGKSKNILNACDAAKKLSPEKIVTLSGFNSNNPLKKLGDINLFINSDQYNFVENIHQFWLLLIVDMLNQQVF